MRNLFLAGIAVAAAAWTGMIPEPAQARDYPFCIKGDSIGSPLGDCSFDTYQQCQAAASGRLAFCDANPYFADERRARVANPQGAHARY
jgi:hypothetical protein